MNGAAGSIDRQYERQGENMFENIKVDAEGYARPGLWGIVRPYLPHPGFKAVPLHRCAHRCHNKRIPLLAGLIQTPAVARPGADISPSAEVGPGSHLPRPVDVVIGSGVKIGRKVRCDDGVTLGPRKTAGLWPTLAGRIHVHSSALVLGRVTGGRREAVGASAVVIEDLPVGTTMAGVSARAIGDANE